MKFYMKFTLPISMIALALTVQANNRVELEGSSSKVIEITPEKSTGLDYIFVVRDIAGITVKCDISNPDAKVYRYSNLGGGYAEEVRNISISGNDLYITSPDGDMGYIIEDGDSRLYFWIVDYSRHVFSVSSVSVSSDSDCSYSVLDVECNATPINYYTINGQQRVLSREIRVDYTTQEYDSDKQDFINRDVSKLYESISSRVMITPPAYCATYFTISGDRFLSEWGMEKSAESVVAAPIAVECRTEASQTFNDDDKSNVIKGDNSTLGGSAPAEILFSAYTTEGVLHHEWQMGRDPNFDTVEYRFNEQNLEYVFNEEGTFYLQYIGSNADGSCEAYGDVYTVNIGASELLCPNAFSPNDDGINDVWKVSYRSIIDFHCWIFDRNGQELYSFDSPDGGWDGKYKGKPVRTGVYYYVIQAEGADGKKYKKSGDINIIRSNASTSSGVNAGSSN